MNILEKNFSLKGKTGIVTGGSSGLGLEMCNTLAQAGAKIYAFSRSGKVKVEINEPLPKNIHHIAVDVCDYDKAKIEIEKIGNTDGLDFLINNAGITEKSFAEEFDLETFQKINKVNVESVFKMCQFAYPYLKTSNHPGRIISISSMAAHLGFTQVTPYCTTKSAITGLTRGLAVEWAKDNILVNSVAPGWFPSEMSKKMIDEERQKKILARMPLHRFGDPKELAGLILYLVSPSASYITGQDFAVDGGALAYGF